MPECGKNISVEKNVSVNSGCRFQDHGEIIIGDGAFIGHKVVPATPNLSENSAIAAGAVVSKGIPAYIIAGDAPAKILKSLDSVL